MITEVIKLIQADEWRGVSERVEFAKGSRKFITTFGGTWNLFKRLLNPNYKSDKKAKKVFIRLLSIFL